MSGLYCSCGQPIRPRVFDTDGTAVAWWCDACQRQIENHPLVRAAAESADHDHPFFARYYDERAVYYTAADERIAQVRSFDAGACRRALALDGLQSTVRAALTRRLRKLERTAGDT